jgi:histone-lysine N-methyltransferase SETMAR
MEKYRVKTMLAPLLGAKVIIRHEFVPGKQTVNGKFYKSVMKRLIARVHRVRPEFQENGSWFLLHDNAPAHSSRIVSEFLTKREIPVLSHPPYLPDLAPADFFLFPKLKIAINGTRFEAISSLQQTVTRQLTATREEAFLGHSIHCMSDVSGRALC